MRLLTYFLVSELFHFGQLDVAKYLLRIVLCKRGNTNIIGGTCMVLLVELLVVAWRLWSGYEVWSKFACWLEI